RVLGAVGDIDVAGAVDRHALRLSELRWLTAGRRAARHDLRPAVDEPVEDTELAVTIEGRDEEIAAAASGRDLRAPERRPVEEARLVARGNWHAAGRDAVDRPEALDLAAGVAASGPGEVERAAGVERRGRGGGNPKRPADATGLEAFAGHIRLDGETRR